MRFNEFKKREYKANRATVVALKQKQALKDKENKQRKWVRKNSSDEADEKMKNDILGAINRLLANNDDKAVTATTVNTHFI